MLIRGFFVVYLDYLLFTFVDSIKGTLMLDQQEIRNHITALRKEKKITIRSMAQKLEIGENTYANFEKGPTEILHKLVFRVAEILGVSVERLLLGENPKIMTQGELMEMKRHSDYYKDVSDRYETTISEQRKAIEDLRHKVSTLEELCETQRKVIALMESKDKQK